MQITITGPRGCGCTTVALEIGKFLKSNGFEVTMASLDPRSTSALQDGILEPIDPNVFTHPNRVVICEGFEIQDQHGPRILDRP